MSVCLYHRIFSPKLLDEISLTLKEHLYSKHVYFFLLKSMLEINKYFLNNKKIVLIPVTFRVNKLYKMYVFRIGTYLNTTN